MAGNAPADTGKPVVAITFRDDLRPAYLAEADLARLRTFAAPVWVPCETASRESGEPAPELPPALIEALAEADALVVCHGAPAVDASLLAHAP